MENKEFIDFYRTKEEDKSHLVNLFYDELADFCMEHEISEEDVTTEQLEEIASDVISNGLDSIN